MARHDSKAVKKGSQLSIFYFNPPTSKTYSLELNCLCVLKRHLLQLRLMDMANQYLHSLQSPPVPLSTTSNS